MERTVIITICHHSLFDYTIKPIAVYKNSLGFLKEENNAVVHKGSIFYNDANTYIKKIIDLTDKISDENLMKRFSRDTLKSKFIKNLTIEMVERYILPYIWNIHSEILKLMHQYIQPIYIRSTNHIYNYDDEINIPSQTAHAVMNFKRDNIGNIHYSISVDCDGIDFNIYRKPFRKLCESPAIVLIGNDLLIFDNIDFSKIQTFFSNKEIFIPYEKTKINIQKFITQCAKKYDIKLEGITLNKIYNEPQKKLYLSSNLHGTLALQLSFIYGSYERKYGTTTSKQVWADTDTNPPSITILKPYVEYEQKCVKELIINGLEEKSNFFYVKTNNNEKDTQLLINWIKEHKKLLHDYNFTQDETKIKYFFGEEQIKTSIEEGNDWFDLKTEAQFDDIKIPFYDLMQTLLEGRREYLLPDKSIAIIPQEWIEKYSKIAYFGKKNGGKIRINKVQYQLLEEIIDKKRIDNLTFSDKDILPTPQGINAKLRYYQKIGFSFLVNRIKNGFGACLADDMGLGKTIQTIALLQYIKNEGFKNLVNIKNENFKKSKSKNDKITEIKQLTIFDEIEINELTNNEIKIQKPKQKPSIIILPTSLVHNWIVELKKFAPKITYYKNIGNKRAKLNDKNISLFDVIITTYGVLRNDIENIDKCHFKLMILDESQNIKNADSEAHKAVKRINCEQTIALSGTPIENSLIDLWSLFDIINPSLLGSIIAFKKLYINNIAGLNEQIQQKNLLRMVEPFIMRRTKETAAPELPPLQEEILYCNMTDLQHRAYDQERSKLRNILSELQLSFIKQKKGQLAIKTLQGLTRLRLLSNHPIMFDKNYKGDSGKFNEVMNRLESLKKGGHKVLVFSSFVKHLKLYANEYDNKKWEYACLIGSSTVEERQMQIDKFCTNSNISTFFISLKAGGIGLNLIVADYVFLLDPWWNPAIENQAISRAHRIGQNKPVIVYRFITTESIEEKIRHLQEEKSNLANTFINNSNPLKNLSSDILISLTE